MKVLAVLFFVALAVAAVFGAEESVKEKRGVLAGYGGLGYHGYGYPYGGYGSYPVLGGYHGAYPYSAYHHGGYSGYPYYY